MLYYIHSCQVCWGLGIAQNANFEDYASMADMLVDEMTIRLTAGSGGKGRAAFNKVKRMQGPSGGDGGHGGSVYLEGVADIGALDRYSNKKEIKADDGKNGGAHFNDGKRGE